MIINKPGAEFEYEGTIYKIGESIVGTPESEYEGLYGSITEIRDGEDKETENETPDLYCTFDPPALPCERKRLEAVFSELYRQPKTLDDIVLDFVIMAPSMVKLLDDLQICRHSPMIYVLLEDWAVDGEHGNTSEVYSDFDDAKRVLVQKLTEERENGCIPAWAGNDEYIEESTPDSYEGYLNGEYMENHYAISIVAQKLYASSSFIREMAGIYEASCQLEDFTSQVADWEELNQLTDEQYEKMIQDLRFPERFQKALSKNDHYWESYWETLSEVAHEFVKQYLEENVKPECYTPEKENPYPLCIGNGGEECKKCCLWTDLQPDME